MRTRSAPAARHPDIDSQRNPSVLFFLFVALPPSFTLSSLLFSPPPPPIMSDPGCRLFVGNLSWNTTDESMRMAFEDGAGVPGSVLDSKVILDRETGRSRGFGFVTFSSPDLASAAIAKMNGMDVDGRQVRVDMASSRQR
ncbi:hypothetical protein I4F81_000433 [Pyropia yezoensis]|uniref:Uncharacterized protein n=1 Tax=Pyropia yezoensis TaxID=2788 RepID=A0ACC3BIP5_PYRYE|nr:hypothetical protein I4F81_000433 [Neopyropia yezoensis]